MVLENIFNQKIDLNHKLEELRCEHKNIAVFKSTIEHTDRTIFTLKEEINLLKDNIKSQDHIINEKDNEIIKLKKINQYNENQLKINSENYNRLKSTNLSFKEINNNFKSNIVTEFNSLNKTMKMGNK